MPQLQCYRSYATRPASRPKAHTGRTTSSLRTKQPKAAGKAAEKQTTARVTKSNKTAQTKTASNIKTSTKPKTKPKVKPKAKVRAKKPVTEEQKAARSLREQRAHIRELRKLALTPPRNKPQTAWSVLNAEVSKEKKGLASQEAGERYKGLIPKELEHYNHIANQNKAENQKTYREWIHSMTPDNIRKANNARRNLKRLGVKGFHVQLLDDRQVARPIMAHVEFCRERFSTGDMKGIAATDALKQIMKEWRELNETDKQKYYNYQAQSRAQYIEGVKNIYHRDIDLSATTLSPTTTAAAA